MPPVDRIVDYYPNIQEFFNDGIVISNIPEHVRYVCIAFFKSQKDVCRHLPFGDQLELWDIEYAIKEYRDEQRRKMLYKPCIQVVCKLGDDEVIGYKDIYPTRLNIRLDYDDDPYEDDDSEDEEQREERCFYFSYEYEIVKTRTVRKEIKIPYTELPSNPEVLKDYLERMIMDGRSMSDVTRDTGFNSPSTGVQQSVTETWCGEEIPLEGTTPETYQTELLRIARFIAQFHHNTHNL